MIRFTSIALAWDEREDGWSWENSLIPTNRVLRYLSSACSVTCFFLLSKLGTDHFFAFDISSPSHVRINGRG